MQMASQVRRRQTWHRIMHGRCPELTVCVYLFLVIIVASNVSLVRTGEVPSTQIGGTFPQVYLEQMGGPFDSANLSEMPLQADNRNFSFRFPELGYGIVTRRAGQMDKAAEGLETPDYIHNVQ